MEFWEKNFVEKGSMWGMDPANSAIRVNDFFLEKGIKKILIPGFGYGRNAKVFFDSGIAVTGIEISAEAINISKNIFGNDVKVYHGSVSDMPFDDLKYEGIYCHALIHLLDHTSRLKLISDCFEQLTDGGHMFFTTISPEAEIYGQGQNIGENRFEMFGGVQMYFYNHQNIAADFGSNGLCEIENIVENYPFYLIHCCKL